MPFLVSRSGRQASETSRLTRSSVFLIRTIRDVCGETRAHISSATTRASRSLFNALGILADRATVAVMQLVYVAPQSMGFTNRMGVAELFSLD